MAYYECGGASKEEPESIIITLVPNTNSVTAYGQLIYIYFYIDDTLIQTYSHSGNYTWTNKTYIYTSPKSNKSVNINIFPNIVDVNGRGYYCPVSLQLGINGIVVSTINANGNNYFMEKGVIVYKYTFS